MTKRNAIIFTAIILSVVIIGGALFFALRPSRSVWDIAEWIEHDDDFYVWIGDDKHHNHFDLTTEPPQNVKDILGSLKLSQRPIGRRPFFEASNMIVLEAPQHTPRVQYFLFNEDFTLMWTADNSWIHENSRDTQDNATYNARMIFNASKEYNEWGNTECDAYHVRNPRAVREFFRAVCEQDTKYDQ